MGDAVGPGIPFQRHNVGDRHQLTAAIAHHQACQVPWSAAIGSLELNVDTADLPAFKRVIDVAAADGRSDVAKGRAYRQVERCHLASVDLQTPSR